MNEAQNETEPTLIDLAERFDSEGMVGFTRSFHRDLRDGFSSVSVERYPWLEDLRKAPWSGVLCLGMGGSAAGGDFLAALTAQNGGCPCLLYTSDAADD